MRTSNLETAVSWLLAQPVVLDLPHAVLYVLYVATL